jgi:hypothetical protein
LTLNPFCAIIKGLALIQKHMKKLITNITKVLAVLGLLFGLSYQVSAQTYYYSNTSSSPYYRPYNCGDNNYSCNSNYYYSASSYQTPASSYTQVASVINAVPKNPVPQLPQTGGGGKAMEALTSAGASISGGNTSILLLELSAVVALILLVSAMLISRNKEDKQLAA